MRLKSIQCWFLLVPVMPAMGWSEAITYEHFMQEVGSAESQIDYSKKLVNRNELKEWIIKSEKKGEGATDSKGKQEQAVGKEEGGRAGWMPSTLEHSVAQGNFEKSGQSQFNPEEMPPPPPVPNEIEQEAKRLAAEARAQNGEVNTGMDTDSTSNGRELGRYGYALKGLGEGSETSYNMKIKGPEKAVLFGISIGTQIKVKLDSGASSVQPGYVQVKVDQDVYGTKKILERGSSIFMRVDAVRGATRLFGSAVRGKTRVKEDEFDIRGNIFGADGQPGFVATVISDGRTLARATDAGLAALGSAALQVVPDTGVVTGAGKSAAGTLMEEKKGEKDQTRGVVNLVVQAEPQSAILQIEETF